MSLTWPNLLSTLRIALIPVFVVTLVRGQAGLALLVFTVAGLTDLLDGFIARFYQQQSVLGAYLDPAADKLLLVFTYWLLGFYRELPTELQIETWISALVITRDVVIVVVALVVFLSLGIRRFPPSRLSKWNTTAQIVAVYMVLLGALITTLRPVTQLLLYVMVALTVGSGLEYAYRFIYRANELVAEPARGDTEAAPETGQDPQE